MTTTIAEAAVDYYNRRKWKPVPVSRKSKKPIGKKWQERPFDPAQFDGNAQNVAIQLGDASSGLTDVDLDSTTAIGLAPEFLPPTDAIFGHRSKPCSHQLYITDLYKTETKATIAFRQYIGGRPGPVIVELRIGGNGKGATTVVPPSMHETGEMVEWVRDGKPSRFDGGKLLFTVRKLAVADVLKTYYPGQGSRHEGALVIGGVLARAGWTAEDIEHVVRVIARAVGDDDVQDRIKAAASAVEAKANGHDVPGLERLREIWGDDVADTLGHWLNLRGPTTKASGFEDRVALDFAAQYADEMHYIAKSSQWMHWTGTCWQTEDTLFAFDLSRTLCRAAGDADAKMVSAVVTLARSDRRLAATTDQWDTDPLRLQTTRTTIDLRNGFEYPPERSHYITKRASTYLAPSGTAHPLWSDFLDTVTNADETLIGFLQRFAGYCLTGLTREHKFAFLYGPGGNGKGVFANTLAKIMGDYAITAPIEMFLAARHQQHPTEIARLKGARLVVAQETQKGRRWDETKLKALTGGDRLSGHFMRQDYFDFDPTHKIIITGNHKPGLSAVNEAIRRRLMLTLFNVVIPHPDPDFAAKLVPEHPAILRWMVDGCLEWQRDGLLVPECVRAAGEQYFANQDTFEQWLFDCVDANDPLAFTTSRVLYTSWKIWSEARGMSPGTEKAFVESLEEKGFEWERRKYGRGFKRLSLYADDRGPPAGDGGRGMLL
jgi:P4 family phage/plasmid primase-like protien